VKYTWYIIFEVLKEKVDEKEKIEPEGSKAGG
jgi:hypothetical protein